MGKFQTYYLPIVTIGVLFFVFGFLTWVNGILIPYFQICLDLSNFESLWVAFAMYLAYFFMAIPSARVLRRTGYKKGIVIGLVVMAAGTLLFIPAAFARTYLLFLAGLFVTGSGLALLQTAAHPYLAIIGPPESTAQRIGFMGVANKTAGILSQQILGAIFLLKADDIIAAVKGAGEKQKEGILDAYVQKVVVPYLVITVILLLLALAVRYVRLQDVRETDPGPHDQADPAAARKSILHYPHLVLGVASLLMAGACEVIPIDGVIIYARSLGIPLEEARHFPADTLYCMLAGYLGSTLLIPRVLSQQAALCFAALAGCALSIVSFFAAGRLSVYLMIAMGFNVAFLWGTIWGLAIRGLGRHTKMGSALMLMSVVGGGLFPLLFGRLIDLNTGNPQTAVLMLVPCYLYLIFYAVYGYRLKRWRPAQALSRNITITN